MATILFHLTVLDWICVIVLLVFGFLGFRRGLVGELFRIAAVVAGLIGSFTFTSRLTHLMLRVFPGSWEKALHVLAFIIAFAACAGIAVLIGLLVSKIISMTFLSWLDKAGGLLLGLMKGMLIIGFVLWIILFVPWLKTMVRVDHTKFAGASVRTVRLVADFAKNINADKMIFKSAK